MDKDVLRAIRRDSLSKHGGATRKYGDMDLDTCIQVIVNRPSVGVGPIKVVFEEHDEWGHGVNVPYEWLTEDHISRNRIPCKRCAGGGKLVIDGIDCTECKGTGRVVDQTAYEGTVH